MTVSSLVLPDLRTAERRPIRERVVHLKSTEIPQSGTGDLRPGRAIRSIAVDGAIFMPLRLWRCPLDAPLCVSQIANRTYGVRLGGENHVRRLFRKRLHVDIPKNPGGREPNTVLRAYYRERCRVLAAQHAQNANFTRPHCLKKILHDKLRKRSSAT